MNAAEHINEMQNLVYQQINGERFGGSTLAMYGMQNGENSMFGAKMGLSPQGRDMKSDRDGDGIPDPLDYYYGPGQYSSWDENHNGINDYMEN